MAQRNPQASTANGARVPPHSVEAEMEILGAMMLQETALYKAIESLKPEDFYLEKHRRIFNAILEVFNRKETVSAVSVREELKRTQELDLVGGWQYLANLVETVISPAFADEDIQTIVENAIYREVIQVASEALDRAYHRTDPAEQLLDHIEQRLLEIRQRKLNTSFRKVEELIGEVQNKILENRSRQRSITGIPSGFEQLDEMTAGFQPGDLVIVASRPSVGKTSFALNIMHHLAVAEGIPSAIFSLEMSAEQLVIRLLSLEAMVSSQKIKTGRLNDSEIERILEATRRLQEVPIYIDDTPSIHILELKAKARRIVRDAKARILFVDYLQLIRGLRAENRVQEISGISQALKALAKELQVPVVALSQLSRAPEHRRDDKRPRLADLRESGSIEQDADVVLFLFRPEMYSREPSEVSGLTEVIIGKQRNGPTGTVKFTFLKDFMKFEPAPEEPDFGYSAYVTGEEEW